ncbi:hypothetical protein FC777_02445 [Clostridium botulinum]|nr:hypothetical protein [Clostridium botulinum]
MNIHELQTLKVDLKDNYIVEVVCKQLDDIILNFEIYNNCVPMELNNFNVELRALKHDNVPLIQDTNITMSNNMVKIKCNPQLTTSSDIVKAELQFIDKTTKQKKSSFNIEIDVKPSVLEVNRSISIPTFTAMERLEKDLDKVRDLEFNFNEADKLNRELKNTTIPTGNTLKTNLDNSISTGTTLKNDIDNRIVTGNKLKTDIDNSSTVATTKKEQLDTANVQATKNIETLNSFGDASQLTKDVTTLKTKVLENTYTKLETDSTLTKLDNCIGEYVHNMQIKGKTLQNLWNGGNVNYLSSENRLIETTTLDLYKTNTNYTIINYNNKKIKLGIFTKANTYSRSIEVLPNSKFIIRLNDEIIKDKVGEEVNGWANSDNDKNELKKSIVILEGEVKEIPPFFEGIKSTGEAEGNKISILTCGKNMVDVMKLKDSPTVKIKSIDKNVVILEQIVDNRKYVQIPIYLTFKPNTKYVLSGNLLSANTCLKIYDLENNIQYSILEKTGSVMFTTREKSNLQLLFYTSNTENENIGKIASFENVMIEEGTTATSYEQYKADKTEILIPNEPIRGLPNGVSDVVDYDKNEITRNVGIYILDQNSDITRDSELHNQNDTIAFYFFPKNRNGQYISVISDKFIMSKIDDYRVVDLESISCGVAIAIRINRNKLETPDVVGFKKWLQANPTTVYYQLAEPKIEKLTIKDTLQTFQDGYIQLNNAITPTAQLEYSTNLPSALSGLTQITDKLVDDVTNVEITISDLDAEIGEARKDKNTLNERLEDDRTNILKTIGQVKDMSMNVKTDSNYEGYDVTKIYTWTKTGTYLTEREGVIDLPSGWNQGRYEVITFDVSNSEYSGQIIFGDPYNKKMAFRYGLNADSKWKQLATVDDTGWLDLPLSDGISSESGWTCQYRKVGKIVQLRGIIKGITTETQSDKVIANLPIGFRPFATNITLLPRSTNDDNYLKIYVSSSGVVGTKGTNMSSIVPTNGFMLTPIMFLID